MVTITRVGHTETPPPQRRVTMRTYPRSAMKGGRIRGTPAADIKGVKDPSKPPPIKKARAGTLRLLTDAGVRQRRKTTKQKLRDKTESEMRTMLKNANIKVGATTPKPILTEILEGAIESGMIVVK